MTNFELIKPNEKIERSMKPYVTFPLIEDCTLKCVYCGDGGEMSISNKKQFRKEDVIDWYEEAIKLGIEKFRITGGEPLLHENFQDIIEEISKKAKLVLINTNGTLIKKYKHKWINSPSNCIFVVNYHGASKNIFEDVTNTNNSYELVREGIELLASEGRLHRLNTVYSQRNAHEIFEIIDYCRELDVDLKIQDVVSVPWQFEKWGELHESTIELEKEFERRASSIKDHKYAKGFGTPSKIYTIDGVDVTLKSVRNGSHYDIDGVCKECNFYKCHEGVYDLFVFPDNTSGACNWTDKSKAPNLSKLEQLKWLIKSFQRSEYREASNSLEEMSFDISQSS